jgi:hypothetical protein
VLDLSGLDATAGPAWDALLDLASRKPEGWTLIGAQMVAVHGWERGRNLPRATVDVDVLVNVRVIQDGTAGFSRVLVADGYELEGVDAFGIGHRFSNGRIKVDVLAPDGLAGGKTRLTTVPPARTVSVPGGTQALRRSRQVEIKRGSRAGQIPCPDLLGAILLKARAVEVGDVPEAQLSDLAFLLGLVEDPRRLGQQLQGRERGWLRRRRKLLDRSDKAWRDLPEEMADNGCIAFRILSGW